MARRIISDDLVAQSASLRKAGLSFRAIGMKLSIDARTAKSLIARAVALDQRQHWESVEQRLDARYLQEHYQMLLYVCTGLMRAVGTDIREASAEPEAVINNQVDRALIPAKELLLQRGIVTEQGPLEDPSVPFQVIERLMEGLMEHEPGLAEAIHGPAGWATQWRRFQHVREDLTKQARGLLSHKNLDVNLANKIAGWQVNRVMQSEGNSEAVFCDSSGLETSEAQSDYAEVLKQVSHPARVVVQQEAASDLANSIVRVEEAVRDLQLRGRPAGRCALCPSKSQGFASDITAPLEG